jgi:hypothetical protein
MCALTRVAWCSTDINSTLDTTDKLHLLCCHIKALSSDLLLLLLGGRIVPRCTTRRLDLQLRVLPAGSTAVLTRTAKALMNCCAKAT